MYDLIDFYGTELIVDLIASFSLFYGAPALLLRLPMDYNDERYDKLCYSDIITFLAASIYQKSKLNPKAPEFVPTYRFSANQVNNHHTSHPHHQQPGHHHLSTSSSSQQQPHHVQFTNGDSVTNYRDPSADSFMDNNLTNGHEIDDMLGLTQLKLFVELVSSEPARYDKEIDLITDVLNSELESDEDLTVAIVVNYIIDHVCVL